MSEQRVVSAEMTIAAPAASIFELIADPSLQPSWDGNANLTAAAAGQRVHAVGDVFVMQIHNGQLRANHVVEFTEGSLVAWKPGLVGEPPFGQLWRWELTPLSPSSTLVRHTYDFTELTDEQRLVRARATGAQQLMASIERLSRVSTRS